MSSSVIRRLNRRKRLLDRPSLNNLDGWKDIVGAEIGVQYGVNSRDILERFDIKTLYLIDPYVPYIVKGVLKRPDEEIAKEYLKEFEDKIIWIKNYSWNAVFRLPKLDFVYIDGNHQYPDVKVDTELYYPKVKIGGLFAGHDYSRYKRHRGVVRAVNEFFSYRRSEELQTGGKWDWWCIKNGEHDYNILHGKSFS